MEQERMDNGTGQEPAAQPVPAQRAGVQQTGTMQGAARPQHAGPSEEYLRLYGAAQQPVELQQTYLARQQQMAPQQPAQPVARQHDAPQQAAQPVAPQQQIYAAPQAQPAPQQPAPAQQPMSQPQANVPQQSAPQQTYAAPQQSALQPNVAYAAPQQPAPQPATAAAQAAQMPAQPASESRVSHVLRWLAASVTPSLVVIASEVAVSIVVGVVFGLFLVAMPIYISTDLVESMLLVAMQLFAIAILAPWWGHIYQRSFLRARRAELPRRSSAAKVVQRVAGIVLMGLGAQVVLTVLVTLVLRFFPTVSQEYSELMEEPTVGLAAVISVLSTVVGAPIMEELAMRGLTFEFSLRAFNFAARGQWRLPRRGVSLFSGKIARINDREAYLAVAQKSADMPPLSFWLANFVQALLFGILHMNITQGIYTFAFAFAFGWVAWKSGKLRYSMLLHFVLNSSSYWTGLMDYLYDYEFIIFVLAMVLVFIAGVALFNRGCDEQTEPPMRLYPAGLAPEGVQAAPAPVSAADACANGVVADLAAMERPAVAFAGTLDATCPSANVPGAAVAPAADSAPGAEGPAPDASPTPALADAPSVVQDPCNTPS